MKKGTLRRLAALFVCLAMLLSGLSFADELVGVGSATEEQSAGQPSGGMENNSGNNDNNHIAGADVPAASDPEENQTSDVFVPESGENLEDESKIAGESDTEDEPKIADESETEGEDEPKVEDESKPESDEAGEEGNEIQDGEQKPEDASNLLPGEETDQGLSTFSVNDVNLDDGIMPIMELPEGHTDEHTVKDYSEPGEDIIGWATRDASGHSYFYQMVTGKWCEDCYAFVEGPKYSVVCTSEIEQHDYYNGVCSTCGYVCKHENKKPSGPPETEVYYVMDASTHQEYKRTVQYFTCDCGKFPLNVAEDPVAVDAAPKTHEYNGDDECDVCGYLKEQQPHDPATHDWQYSGRSVRYLDCEPNEDGATCHATKREIVNYIYCQTCEELGNEFWFEDVTEEQGSFTLNHSWNDKGVCEYCGYVKNCEHKNSYVISVTRTDDIANAKFQINADGTHTGTVKIMTRYMCPDCGQEFTIFEATEETAPHEFYPSYSEDAGVCEVCGYKCNHAHWIETGKETIPAFEEDDEAPVKDDEKTHHFPYSYVRTVYWCPDCEQEYTVAGERQANPVTEPHDFDPDGYCAACGYHNPDYTPCKHRDFKTDASEFELIYTATYGVRNVTPTTHDLLIEKYYAWRCPDCGRLFDSDDDGLGLVKSEYEVLEKQPHEWTANGYCSEPNCGYKNPCAHTDTAEGEVEIYAAVSQIPGDAANHLVSGIRYTSKHCNTCGQDFDLEFQETFTDQKQRHTFVNGACEVCGYERGTEKCDHTDRTPGEPKVETSYEPVDDEYHNRIVSTTPTETCNDCGEVIEGKTTTQSFKEAHGAGYDAKDGVCSLCKHECSHKDHKQLGEVKHDYVATDASHTDATTTPWTCTVCGASGEDKQPAGEPKAHSYALDAATNEYVCSECKHVCKHEGAAVTESAPKDEHWGTPTQKQHVKEYTVTVTTDCKYCDYVKPVDETRKGTAENHTWDAETGKCSVCGYSCQHEYGAPVKEDTWEENYTKLCDETHTQTGTEVVSETCTNCGNVRKSGPTPVERTVKHSYKDGVCEVCGHTCSHEGFEKTERVPVAAEGGYSSNGASGHSVKGDIHTVTSCTNCTKTLEDVVMDEDKDQTWTEKHSFKGDKCTLCGYVKPAEQEQPEQPIAKDEPVYEEVAQGETVHGVTVGAEAHMTETLTQAIQGIQAEYGESAQLAIRDAEKVIPKAEYERFTKIDPVEQMMVLLKVIGFDDEVERGMADMGIALSEDALALVESLESWTDAMSSEERAAFQKLIEQFFPVLNESGAERVEITLEITRGDNVRLERYAFERVDGEWIFIKLEVANI